jgi:hypothetical protein
MSAPVPDAASEGGNTGSAGATSLSWNHTVGASIANSAIVVTGQLSNASGSDISNVQWDAAGTPVGFTKFGSVIDSAGFAHTAQWLLKSPASGTKQVKITAAASAQISGGAASFSNVDQTTPWNPAGPQTNIGSTSPQPSLVVTSGVNELAIASVADDENTTNDALTVSASSGTTTTINNDSIGVGLLSGRGDYAPGASSVTFTYAGAHAGDTTWAVIGGSLRGVASGGGIQLTRFKPGRHRPGKRGPVLDARRNAAFASGVASTPVSSSGTSPTENARSLAVTSGAPDESIQPITKTAGSPDESIASATNTRTSPDENTQAIVATAASSDESLGRIAGTRTSPDENLANATASRVAPYEWLLRVAGSVVDAWESLGGIRTSVTSPDESLRAVTAATSAPDESLQRVAGARVSPDENLGVNATPVSQSQTSPWESLGAVRKTAAAPSESLGRVQQAIASSFAWIAQVRRALQSAWENWTAGPTLPSLPPLPPSTRASAGSVTSAAVAASVATIAVSQSVARTATAKAVHTNAIPLDSQGIPMDVNVITFTQYETGPVTIKITDADGVAVDLSGLTVPKINVAAPNGTLIVDHAVATGLTTQGAFVWNRQAAEVAKPGTYKLQLEGLQGANRVELPTGGILVTILPALAAPAP